MSVISTLVIEPKRLPSFLDLCIAVRLARDPIEFSHEFEFRPDTGFVPVKAYGRNTGFELFQEIRDKNLPAEALRYGSHLVVTRTGSNFEEGRAALLFLKIAARLTRGAYVYPDDGIVVAPDDVAAYLDEQIAEYGKHIKGTSKNPLSLRTRI
jgi:hypothetical protein